ncbi:DUF4381 domain-containing protein [Shewanella sp. GXUN23E]|uniref:DUF4381 domain-containing protein n=1 Tax=Shewanella sp. GXUN23E TaxID=3422498 RepID=UPI003D7DBA98
MTATSAANVPANPALAQLKDIHLPQEIGLWPLAPGYYLLLALIIVILLALFWLYRRRQTHLAACRQAKHLLAGLDMTSNDYAQQVNTLLKRTALSYLPRNAVAGLDDASWLAMLSHTLPEAERQELSVLLGNRFAPQPLSSDQANALKQLALRILDKLPSASMPEAKSC